ncbi:MAG: hypothetical protein GX604_03960 [Actinobacteria bacterium]|nr:hypothetical protein [Actinomycetota bacterium]
MEDRQPETSRLTNSAADLPPEPPSEIDVADETFAEKPQASKPHNVRTWLRAHGATALVFAVIYVVLIIVYQPHLLFAQTTTSGGDMGAHHYPAKYLIEYLLPHLKVTGWTPQWYAGMPMLTFYMPLPFLIIAFLSYVIPYSVAFKLTTVLGVFLLPLAAYAFGRLFRIRPPFPLLAAGFALAFLFMNSYSIYGANILSTLAGEFGYSISFALVFIFLGTLHRGLERGRYDWLFAVNGLILMCLVLSHIVTTIALCIIAPSLLLLHRRWRAVGYMAAVFVLGFCLTAFWGLPFVDKIQWVANVDWIPLKLFKDLVPPEIRFISAVGVLGMAFAVARKEWKLFPLMWTTVAMIILFFVLPKGMLWNGRLLPFLYFSLHLWAAYGATWLLRPFAVIMRDLLFLRGSTARRVYPVAIAIGLGIAVAFGSATAVGWINWNYSGYERKAPWPEYRATLDFLQSLPANSRIMWEHSSTLDKFGTPRILELIPYWTDQPTMEGTLMESSFTAPYHFINQAELSLQPSHAIGGVDYPPQNTTDGVTHLQFMNIPYMVAVSPEVTDSLKSDPRVDFLAEFDVMSVFRISGTRGYVEVMRNEPVRVKTNNWRDTIVPWYKDVSALDVGVIWDRGQSQIRKYTEIYPDQVTDLPVQPIEGTGQVLYESVENERITFQTTAIGQPHWIKMSYFPNWKVKGAEGPFIVSPSFMMVIPTQNEVTLYYGSTASDIVGRVLVIVGWFVVIGVLFLDGIRRTRRRHSKTGANPLV